MRYTWRGLTGDKCVLKFCITRLVNPGVATASVPRMPVFVINGLPNGHVSRHVRARSNTVAVIVVGLYSLFFQLESQLQYVSCEFDPLSG